MLSLYERLAASAAQAGRDLFFVQNGDLNDGTGLSRVPPATLVPLIQKMPFDALTTVRRGNPDLSPGPSSSRGVGPDLGPSPSPIPGGISLPCPRPPRTPVAVQSRATMSCTRTRPSSTSRALMASSTAGGAPSSLRTYSTPPRASRSARAPSCLSAARPACACSRLVSCTT